MKGPKQNLYKLENYIVFQKPVQISPPSTPEEIYTIQPKPSLSTLKKKSTNMETSSSNQQQNHQDNNNANSPNFPQSVSPKRLGEQCVSPLKLMRNTYDNIDSPISRRLPNRRATKLCTKVLQKYKNKYFI
ncbi:unnamed protein product [Paramecium pentaurelia]|uniref:Uncharacterized protein n=1 Tax=Paramecium pentaurelia TaxID=43138 RepID=A0A8S1XF08_9CILI|nr:unnamed protein product [Paramecium pentaurelia]